MPKVGETGPKLPTYQAIDWERQPPIPADRIDWQGQGEPLRVRPTLGTLITIILAAASVIGAGAFFYWGTRTHISNQQIHLRPNGTMPTLLSERYETRTEAKAARAKLGVQVQQVGQRVDRLDQRLVKMQEDQARSTRKLLQAVKNAQ